MDIPKEGKKSYKKATAMKFQEEKKQTNGGKQA